jgi:hypothetical protein
VRFLQVVFWGLTAAMAWLAWSTRVEDPVNLHMSTLILAPFGAACALGIEVYLRCYVTTLRASATELAVETLSTIGRTRRVYPIARVVRGRVHRTNPYLMAATTGFFLDNAWSTLRVHGRRLPFIVDAT